jgi:hypothetical protein
LDDLLEKGVGAEQAGQSVVLDQVQLGHGQGDVLGQAAQDLAVFEAEAGTVVRVGPLVVGLEDADDVLPVLNGDGQQAPQGRLEQLPVPVGSPGVMGRVDRRQDLARPGDMGGEILARQEGDVAGEIGMGQEGVVPDERLQVSAQRVVLFQDVER